jgi:hypothetical protein
MTAALYGLGLALVVLGAIGAARDLWAALREYGGAPDEGDEGW